jgi:hypothetical protein
MKAHVFCQPCDEKFVGPSMNFACALFAKHTCTKSARGKKDGSFCGDPNTLDRQNTSHPLEAENAQLRERLQKIAAFAVKGLEENG